MNLKEEEKNLENIFGAFSKRGQHHMTPTQAKKIIWAWYIARLVAEICGLACGLILGHMTCHIRNSEYERSQHTMYSVPVRHTP
jgi:hypothetical protein